MDENISQVIEMTMSVFLFVFALSCAILSYNQMSDTAENMISINLENRRGTTANTRLEPEDMLRKTDYGEIVLSALNLEKMYLTSGLAIGTFDYEIKVVRKNGAEYSFSYEQEETENAFGEPNVIGKLVFKNGATVIRRFIVSASAGTTEELYNNFLDAIDGYVNFGAKYTISYTSKSIIFKEV